MDVKPWVATLVSYTAAALCAMVIYNDVMAVIRGNIWALGPAAFFTILMVLFIIRKPSKEASGGLKNWVIALSGTLLPFCLQIIPEKMPLMLTLSVPIQLIGCVVTLLAILALGRGFGIIAANRQIQTHGLYRWVRHPLYAGEAIWFLSLVLQNITVFNVGLLCVQLLCQVLRMKEEERFLSGDPVYAEYLTQVRYRILPGVF